MQAVILNFTGDRKNWGCQATSAGLYRFLSHALKPHGFSEIATVLLPHSHIQDLWHRKKYGARIRDILSVENPDAEKLEFLARLCQSRFGFHLNSVKNADLVFFQGEGTMGPSKFYENCRVFALPYLAKKLWDKPVISINQSFVTGNEADLKTAVNIFNAFNLNVFRETKSWNIATDNGIKDAVLCPDFAFVDAADAIDKTQPKVSEKYFCVTGSAGLDEYDIDGYINSIEALHVETGLLPVCIYSRKSDRMLVQAVKDRLGENNIKVITQSAYKSHSEILPQLAQAAFTIGGRYHTAISSLCMKTPVILTAGNTHKNEGLGDLLAMEIPVMQPNDSAAIVKQAKFYLENKTQIMEGLVAGLKGVLKSQSLFLDYLSENIPEILENKPVQAPKPDAEVTKVPLSLPSIKVRNKTGDQFSRLRTQFDLGANLRQSKWGVESV